MNVTPLSFGRIVKVNAPLEVADKVTDLVNGKGRGEVAKVAKGIFCDYGSGEAVAYNPTGRKNVSYIFSGSDANKAREIETDMRIECERVCDYYHGDTELVNAGFANASDRAFEKLNALIKSKNHVASLNVLPSNDGSEIKFLDLNLWI